jgi:hypothetical protein
MILPPSGRPPAEHTDEHRLEDAILLAVDQEFDHPISSPLIADAPPTTSILFDVDVR